eukprot:TRINITY_DN3087_c0_g1_i2.p1 TRINITY_DN3087_c0_g1~~TRINITY_DN3087_c0_g1_i2.p1  ORF type:complete len:364 (-),score=126.71 TRINITY_DN3087_c0_g1_i2:36-1127(-)
MEEQVPQEETLATPGVIDKYQAAGKVANIVLEGVIARCVPGARIYDICLWGDNEINNELTKVYNKKRIEKGLAFPTSISVNEVCGYYSPLKDDEAVLNEGDVAKIQLGAHIDGYIGIVAHTVVVSADPKKPVEADRKSDVVLAAYNALQASLRLLKPGSTNAQVTETIGKIAAAYKVNPLEGVLSHELKKHLIDGNSVIINKETFDQRVEEAEFQVNQVFALDIIITTGEGKPKESDLRTTVYKRALERTYTLKTKNARAFFSEVNEKFPTLAFSLRSFTDEIGAKVGVSECMKHDLLNPYPILVEKTGEFVAHFQWTVLILKGGTICTTGLPINVDQYKTQNKIEDAGVLELLTVRILSFFA